MGPVESLIVEPAEDGVRLDRWFRRRWPHLSQGQIEKLARTGQIRVDGGRVKADSRLAAGVTVRIPPLPDAREPATPKPLAAHDVAFAKGLVILEDADVLVLNKPAGLAVQGGTKTLRHLDGLLSAWGEGAARPRLTHRLDRDTSGVLVLGRSVAAAAALAAAFAGRKAIKTYWALVAGAPDPPQGLVELALAKTGGGEREQMTPVEPGDPRGLPARTRYFTLSIAPRAVAWLALSPETGRTHQLRAHLLAIGHPILGDPKYNTPRSREASGDLRLQLHARRHAIPHPAGGTLDVEAPPSPQFEAGLARFGLSAPDFAAG